MQTEKPSAHRVRKGVGLAIIVCSLLGLGIMFSMSSSHSNPPRFVLPSTSRQFDAQQAYQNLEDICRLGPRITASPAMKQQQRILEQHFQALGASVRRQVFSATQPSLSGRRFECTNLIVHWRPESKRRVLLGAHYDTRPMADREPVFRNRKGKFLGANDGASGVGLLMELGRMISSLELHVGVDFVFFDAEEYIFDNDRDDYFIGSEHFVDEYIRTRPEYTYLKVIVVDMIADRDLRIHPDQKSFVRCGALVSEVFGIAKELGVGQFDPRPKYEIRDDHLAFQDEKIPAIVLIDFDYPYWHRLSDTPDKCSPQSLGAVATVLIEWLRRQQEPAE